MAWDPVTLITIGVAIAAGLVAGVTSGLFGVGGGVVMVPVLHYLVGMPFRLATMVSLFIITFNTPFGLYRHHRHGNVGWFHGAILALGGLVGVVGGTIVRPYLPVPWLKAGFAIVMLFAAYRMIRYGGARVQGPEGVVGERLGELAHTRGWRPNVALLAGGALAGIAAHLFGIGGGLLMVPVLVFLGLPIHHAVATSLVAVFTNAAFSTLHDAPVLVHHLEMAVPLGIGAIVGIHYGVHLANRLAAHHLRRGFGVFLALMAIGVLLDSLLTGTASP